VILSAAFVVKVVSAIAVALVAIYAAEHLGPVWGGMIAGFPSTVGPAYIILAIDSGDAFVAQSALASAAAMTAIYAFTGVLALAARRVNPWLVMPLAWAAWAGVSAAVRAVSWTVPAAVVAGAIAFVAMVVATRPIVATPVAAPPVLRRWYDLLVRATVAGGFVGLVTAASFLLGATATGILTMFPIVFSTLAIILLARMGGAVVAATFANALWPMLPLPFAMAVVHLTAVPWGSAVALSLGLAICVGWSAALIAWRHTRPTPAL
jgi:hypothetical protein